MTRTVPFLVKVTRPDHPEWIRAALDVDDARILVFDQLLDILGSDVLGHPAAISTAHLKNVGLTIKLATGVVIDARPTTSFFIWDSVDRPMEEYAWGPGMPDVAEMIAIFNLRKLALA